MSSSVWFQTAEHRNSWLFMPNLWFKSYNPQQQHGTVNGKKLIQVILLSLHEFLCVWTQICRVSRLDMGVVCGTRTFRFFNQQTRYFHKKVNCQLFKKCYFWECDVENWVWTKLALWICPILWIWIRCAYTTFLNIFNQYLLIRAICPARKKKC